MIREAGCSFVIVGHSERRQYFGETNETVARRVRAALLQGLTCILCVGEGIDDRVQGTTNHVLREQLRTALFDTSFNDDGIEPDKQWSIQSHLGGLVIAYEPIWAIGTGKVASLEEISDAHTFIRAFLKEKIGVDTTPILYGGSVKGSNVRDILSTFGVSGALVGGASLIPEEVYSFAQACQG
jgi:triosephosphate isomerase